MSRLIIRFQVIVFIFAAALCAHGQTARFSGQVTDPQSAAVPNADVHIYNLDSATKTDAKTDGNGFFVVPYLPAGHYRVEVQAPGFAAVVSNNLTLSVGEAHIVNLQLGIAATQTTVSVNGTSEVTQINTESAEVSGTITGKEVAGLQLNGRNFSQLIALAAGVSNQTSQDEARVGMAGSVSYSVNGGRTEYNSFQVDGSEVLNVGINKDHTSLIVTPSIDAIQEIKVLTSNYGAQYPSSGNGTTIITTKSGTDKYHGNVYEFVRNEMFNARNYFDQPDPIPLGYTGKRTYRTPLYRRIDAGATLGGPFYIPGHYNVNKTKTFFFFSEEVRREKTPVDYNQAVPTAAERKGIFDDVCPTLTPGTLDTFDPSAYPDCPQGPLNSINEKTEVGRTVSVNYTSAAILNSGLIPLPNSSSGCNSTNPTALDHCYVDSVSPPTHWREELFRIDHNLTEKERLSFRYIHDAWDTVTLAPQWGVVHNSFPTVENQLKGPGLNVMVSLAQTLPHGFVNLITGSYEVQHISLSPQPGPGVASLSRPTILDDPASLGGTPVSGSSLCSQPTASSGTYSTPSTLTECPMGYIFNNGFGGNKLPGLVFQGNNGAYGGHGFAVDTGYAPWTQSNPTFNLRDDAVPQEPLKALAQDVRGNALRRRGEFLEARPAQDEVADDQKRPAVAENIQAARDGTRRPVIRDCTGWAACI